MSNSYRIVREFEETIAGYCGAKYGIAVESCTFAIFLCCKYRNIQGQYVYIPKYTYPGVAMSIIHAGGKPIFTADKWIGYYTLKPIYVIDSAAHFKKSMYYRNNIIEQGHNIHSSLWCLSFHIKKHIPIGRGGMILTNDPKANEWFRQARFNGRKEIPLIEDNAKIVGWNGYMTPEQAVRGLMLFDLIKDKNLPDIIDPYPDLSKWKCFK